MAANVFQNITARGTKAAFENAMATAPNVWEKHAQPIPSDGPDEAHVWMGMLPEPRQFLNARNFVGILDFTYTVTNQEYELSFLIDQNSVEDDRHSLINARIAEAAEVWATFKDSQFASLLINGETATTTYDGNTFHDDTRTIGDSAAIDNSLTQDITTVNAPTLAEIQAAIKEIIETMWRYEDDTGRVAYNAAAMNRLALIIAPEHQRIVTEAINSTLVGGGDSNPFFQNIAEFDVLPYLTDADNAIYMSALGATRKPFIYQERTALQVVTFNSEESVSEHHGVMVLIRQRYRLAYGEFRRNVRNDFT